MSETARNDDVNPAMDATAPVDAADLEAAVENAGEPDVEVPGVEETPEPVAATETDENPSADAANWPEH